YFAMISRLLPNLEPAGGSACPTIFSRSTTEHFNSAGGKRRGLQPWPSLRRVILQPLQFFQRPTGFNLFARHRDSRIHLAGQTGHDKSRRRVRNHQVVLWPSLPPSENSHNRFSICLGIPAR